MMIDDIEHSEFCTLPPTRRQTADYIGALARELSVVAKQADLDLLVHLLDMVASEAEHIVDLESPAH